MGIYSRREWIAVVGAVGLTPLTGCIGDSDGGSGDDETDPPRDTVDGSGDGGTETPEKTGGSDTGGGHGQAPYSDLQGFPMFQRDPANTGYASQDTGPTASVTEQWRVEREAGNPLAAPAVVDGTVYVPGEQLFALDAEESTVQWQSPVSATLAGPPTVRDGTLYTISNQGTRLYAIDTSDGSVEWRIDSIGEYGTFTRPTVESDTIYTAIKKLSERGTSYLVALNTRDGSEQWRYEVGAGVSIPAVLDDTVYATDAGTLYAVDATNGRLQWENGQVADGAPTVVDGTVYGIRKDGRVFGVDAVTGDEQWRFMEPSGVESSPAVAEGTVYVGSSHHSGDSVTLYALDASDGRIHWRFDSPSGRIASPVVADSTVYAASGDGNLYAVDTSDGSELWRFQGQESDMIALPPALVEGTIYWSTNPTNTTPSVLYALAEE